MEISRGARLPVIKNTQGNEGNKDQGGGGGTGNKNTGDSTDFDHGDKG